MASIERAIIIALLCGIVAKLHEGQWQFYPAMIAAACWVGFVIARILVRED